MIYYFLSNGIWHYLDIKCFLEKYSSNRKVKALEVLKITSEIFIKLS
jgi:hypothetical protein